MVVVASKGADVEQPPSTRKPEKSGSARGSPSARQHEPAMSGSLWALLDTLLEGQAPRNNTSSLKSSAGPLRWWTGFISLIMSSQIVRRWVHKTDLLSSRFSTNSRLLAGLVHSPCRRTMATRKIMAGETEDMSSETIAKRLEIMRTMEHRLPYDPWAQPVETFGESADPTCAVGLR